MSSTKRDRILITGAAGFTGHHMVAEAVKAGFTVRATDVSSRHYGAMFDALGVEFRRSDLTQRQGLDALLEGTTGVIHVAGIHDYSTPDKVIFAVNVRAVENICDAAIQAGVERFIHTSSVGVYGYSANPGNPVSVTPNRRTISRVVSFPTTAHTLSFTRQARSRPSSFSRVRNQNASMTR